MTEGQCFLLRLFDRNFRKKTRGTRGGPRQHIEQDMVGPTLTFVTATFTPIFYYTIYFTDYISMSILIFFHISTFISIILLWTIDPGRIPANREPPDNYVKEKLKEIEGKVWYAPITRQVMIADENDKEKMEKIQNKNLTTDTTEYKEYNSFSDGQPLTFNIRPNEQKQPSSMLYSQTILKSGIPEYTQTYCTTCNIWRPTRSSHCSMCDGCFDRYDHHCGMIGVCIARDNIKYFLALLFFAGCGGLMMAIIEVLWFIDNWHKEGKGIFSKFPVYIGMILIIIALQLSQLMCFSIGQAMQISRDVTTKERFGRNRRTDYISCGESVKTGLCCRNWRDIFSSSSHCDSYVPRYLDLYTSSKSKMKPNIDKTKYIIIIDPTDPILTGHLTEKDEEEKIGKNNTSKDTVIDIDSKEDSNSNSNSKKPISDPLSIPLMSDANSIDVIQKK